MEKVPAEEIEAEKTHRVGKRRKAGLLIRPHLRAAMSFRRLRDSAAQETLSAIDLTDIKAQTNWTNLVSSACKIESASSQLPIFPFDISTNS